MSPTRSVISLFTGAGGLDLGLDAAGFSTRVAVEVDRFAQETLALNQHHFRGRRFPILGDITQYQASDIVDASGIAPGDVDLVAGGPPCQSFSTAGRRGSIGDPRGGLFANFADVVAAAQPRFFVMENVRGIISAAIQHRPLAERNGHPLRPEEEQGSAFRVILNVLEHRLNYQIVWGLVDAADYGVPQNRLRVLILGSRDNEFPSDRLDDIVPPTHRGNWVPLRTALSSVRTKNHEYLRYTPDREAIMRLVPPGKNWRWFRDNPEYGPRFVSKIMGGAWGAEGGRVGFFRRLDPSKPSPTLPASPIQKSTSLCHPTKHRPLSVQEYAAIQQFPDDYNFAGGTAQKYKQIGNAVPLGLGRAVGDGLMAICRRKGTVRELVRA